MRQGSDKEVNFFQVDKGYSYCMVWNKDMIKQSFSFVN